MIELEHAAFTPRAAPRIEYAPLAPGALAAGLPPDVLAAIVFGRSASLAFSSSRPDPRLVHVRLDPVGSVGSAAPAAVELWRASGPVHTGHDGPVRYSADEEHLAGMLELDERDHGGIAAAAEWAYASIRRFQSRCGYPHLLRMWNYFDAINRGEGDGERYKQFCLGRAAGLGSLAGSDRAGGTASLVGLTRPTDLASRAGARGSVTAESFAAGRERTGFGSPLQRPHAASGLPAATAIGRRDGSPILQVHWLAARTPGTPLENPRQVSAYQYPREYGPAAPSFSRAMLVARRLLMISGTASIVGHASSHAGSLRDQLDETLANLASVLERAAAVQPSIPRRWGGRTLFKVYLRDGAEAGRAAAHLSERLPSGVQCLMLKGDICRAELLAEIECTHG